MMSTTNIDAPPFVWPPKTAPWLSKTSPWLLLPPVSEGNNNLVYQFYTLGENKLLGLKKRHTEDEDEDGTEEKKEDETSEDECCPADKSKIVSSTRGWLALIDQQSRYNYKMFLSNPLTRRHIKLPPSGLAKHFILSSSDPDDPHCRALATFGARDYLSFCCPGHSTRWTPLGDRYEYASCAYSPKQNLFFCIWIDQQVWPYVDHLVAWDLRDPLSPRNIPMAVFGQGILQNFSPRSKYLSNKYKFLVVAEASDELFQVTRFVDSVGHHGHDVRDEYYGPKMGLEDGAAYTTVGFDVHKYDPETGSFVYMDRSLGGYVFFVGCNDGIALPAAEFPELKPDSIYYTCPPGWHYRKGGHDVGIFNYQDNTLSPCYYPPDMQSKKTICAPMWFTPTPLIRFPFLVDNDDGSLSCA